MTDAHLPADPHPYGPLDGIVVIIPSLHPSEALTDTVTELLEHGVTDVVVVDDGSGAEYRHRFDELAGRPGCTVLTHEVNRGKGAALKTAFAHCLERPDVVGVVTADADGQHAIEDIVHVATALAGHVVEAEEDACVFGVRDFTLPDLPARSTFGNRLTTGIVKLLFGQVIPDTQTGLRGFSRRLLPALQGVKGTRFEYEMNVLMYLLTFHVPVHQVPIRTIYHDHENSQSHFRPVRDSVLVYGGIGRQFLKFALSSGVGALVDILVFVAVIDLAFGGRSPLGAVATATGIARVTSALTNYGVNRYVVFGPRRPVSHSLPRYVLLAIAIFVSSSALTSALAWANGGHVVWAKIVVDTTLFAVSYLVQKRWVFTPRRTVRAT